MSAAVALTGNDLTEEERQWVEQLTAAVEHDPQVKVQYNSFELAAFAIVGKGDMKKMLKRARNWSNIVEKYDLNGVSSDDATAWSRRKMDSLMISCGRDHEGRNGYGLRFGDFQPAVVVQNDEDLRMLVRSISDNFRSLTPTLSEVRRGIVMYPDFSGVGWRNMDMKMEQKISEIYQDGFPVKLKRTLVINPPLIFQAIFAVAKLFIKKKLLDRVVLVKADEFKNYFPIKNVSTAYGGTYSIDFWDHREEGLKQYRASVAEMQHGSTRLAATMLM